MEGTNSQEPVFEGETPNEEGEGGDNERRNDTRLTNSDYIRAKEGWRKFQAGEWTARELEEYLRDNEVQNIMDIFGGKEC